MSSSAKFAAAIEGLAPSRVTVLLRGSPRAALERAARTLHERSPRAEGPFIVVECDDPDPEYLEGRLFGGPHGEIAGAIVHAMTRGTLYVGAVDSLPRILQPRFLSFLDGDRRVRVVAGTSVALEVEIAAGRFRADLGERLLLVQLLLP